jgi:hypothetical protein
MHGVTTSEHADPDENELSPLPTRFKMIMVFVIIVIIITRVVAATTSLEL